MRGDIFRFNSNDRRGHKQQGSRFAVVLQSDDLAVLSTTLVAPTSTSARPTIFRPQISLDGKQTSVLVEQLTVVNPNTELGDFVGRLAADELIEIERALTLVLGMF